MIQFRMPILDIILLTFIILLILYVSIALVLFLHHRYGLPLWARILVPTFIGLVGSISSFAIYLSFCYVSSKEVDAFLIGDGKISVTEKDSYYLFDDLSCTNKAIIFYGGAKVEEISYAPLCRKIADKGTDVFLVKMPFHFPLLGVNKADSIVKEYSYDEVTLMGHSLGGSVASICLDKTSYDYRGIIFLASFPNQKLDDRYKAISIYGDCDKVLFFRGNDTL